MIKYIPKTLRSRHIDEPNTNETNLLARALMHMNYQRKKDFTLWPFPVAVKHCEELMFVLVAMPSKGLLQSVQVFGSLASHRMTYSEWEKSLIKVNGL